MEMEGANRFGAHRKIKYHRRFAEVAPGAGLGRRESGLIWRALVGWSDGIDAIVHASWSAVGCRATHRSETIGGILVDVLSWIAKR